MGKNWKKTRKMTSLDIFAKENSIPDWPKNLLLREYSAILYFICQLNNRKNIFI